MCIRSSPTLIERFDTAVGEYVSYWAIIAVFAYYYEVIARFVFNSPTNWVHESMFLMFGMQYMLCGAFAYKEDQHVRVDVFYAKLSPRGKAIADIVTSVFFFIFVGTMCRTGARFAMDAVSVGEHSFTEWGIQYWPVKLAIPDRRGYGKIFGAIQGFSTFGGIAGPLIAGLIYDIYGSYHLAFFSFAIMMVLTALLTTFLKRPILVQ